MFYLISITASQHLTLKSTFSQRAAVLWHCDVTSTAKLAFVTDNHVYTMCCFIMTTPCNIRSPVLGGIHLISPAPIISSGYTTQLLASVSASDLGLRLILNRTTLQSFHHQSPQLIALISTILFLHWALITQSSCTLVHLVCLFCTACI